MIWQSFAENRNKMVQGIANGVDLYLGIGK